MVYYCYLGGQSSRPFHCSTVRPDGMGFIRESTILIPTETNTKIRPPVKVKPATNIWTTAETKSTPEVPETGKERPSVRNKPTQNNADHSSEETITTNAHSCISVNKTSLIKLTSRVVNLSNTKLTSNQISLLSKGITFVPSPNEPDISEIHNDVNQFIRRLALHLHFADDNK